MSESCWRRVEEAKKKKGDTAWTPEFGESYQFWCPTRDKHQHVAKIGVSVQPIDILRGDHYRLGKDRRGERD